MAFLNRAYAEKLYRRTQRIRYEKGMKLYEELNTYENKNKIEKAASENKSSLLIGTLTNREDCANLREFVTNEHNLSIIDKSDYGCDISFVWSYSSTH
jgi:hypothetical protein